MEKFAHKIFGAFLLAAVAILLSGCSSIFPESWNDPTYFGNSENYGKDSGSAGTGYEIWEFDYF